MAKFKNGNDVMNRGSVVKTCLALRGGKRIVEDDEDDNENDDYNEDDEDDEDDDFDDDDSLDRGKNLPMMNTVTSIWQKTPPMTQVYIASSMAITLLSFILNKNKWPQMLHFDWKAIATGQLWRIYTAFLFFGQLDMFYPLTMQFVWQHMSQLEKLNYSKPEEFLVMVLFGAATLITLYSLLGISMKFLGHNLATYLVYIWSRVFEGSDVNFMDLLTLKSEMLPWFFCAQTFLLEREIPFADLLGIVVGHLYHYLTQKKIIVAPQALREWFQSETMLKKYARFKNDFE
eukprot:CAMPEP_0174973170 /NCGR_PEP_ID=MMETSP0004_2-20121128/11068_1 /TAXON_ID=420556 /ORGANISM="Ochromonas sp., Strain CCMP1393" /LENGTH=287 /DNA_ID=CAMNT_0016223539 /DNA_START=178 /DNA_END=1041 /DNA_ORIENTATION=-